ncbi:MAG: hypothetical protein ACOX0L_01270 [Natronincolaceae bacterium]|jgi:hypothetical protein
MLLHINGNYPYHSLHSELVNSLADMGYQQVICAPQSDERYKDTYKLKRPEILYANDIIITAIDRIFFSKKIRKILTYIENNIDMSNIKCILAHTIFSDGVVAYKLNRKYGIPYSIAVRNTDINVHMKYRKHLIPLMGRTIEHTNSVIFISPSYIQPIKKS